MSSLKRFTMIFAGAMVALLNQGVFAAGVAPPDTAAILYVDDQNQVIWATDPAGVPLEECQLCNLRLEKRYGPGCKNLYLNPALDPSVNLCAGGQGTTLAMDSIKTQITRHDAYCWLFHRRSAGKTRVFQFCRP